jgi:6-phosphogluconate dehydrogenase
MSLQLTMVGLGRMGAGIVRRIAKHAPAGEISISVFDVSAETVNNLAKEGFTGLTSLADLAKQNNDANPQVVWIMVPAEVTSNTIAEVAKHLTPGSIIIDGGNSFYRDDIVNANKLKEKGIHFVDVGTSGGVWGFERGFSLMIGGDVAVVNRLTPIFESLAPGFESAPRTPGKTGTVAASEKGYYHCGPVGAGHFVKMVHNGIEYGAMAAYAEGLNLLGAAKEGIKHPVALGGVTQTQYDLNLKEISEVWRRGSVVASWLLDLTAQAYEEDPELNGYEGSVSDSGEGRWTVQTAIDAAIPAHVLSASLMSRFSSRGRDKYANKVLSAMRKKFGGHVEPKK